MTEVCALCIIRVEVTDTTHKHRVYMLLHRIELILLLNHHSRIDILSNLLEQVEILGRCCFFRRHL